MASIEARDEPGEEPDMAKRQTSTGLPSTLKSFEGSPGKAPRGTSHDSGPAKTRTGLPATLKTKRGLQNIG